MLARCLPSCCLPWARRRLLAEVVAIYVRAGLPPLGFLNGFLAGPREGQENGTTLAPGEPSPLK